MSDVLIDPGAERATLAGVLCYGMDAYIDICDFINCNSFMHGNNSVIYKCAEKVLLDGGEIDMPSILSAADQLGLIEVVKTPQELEYIRLLTQFQVNKENVARFASQVKKYEFARNARRVAGSIIMGLEAMKGDESIERLIAMVEDPVFELIRQDSTSKEPSLLFEELEAYVEYLKDNPVDQLGIASGFPIYDAAIGGGLRRKCVDLISARPKVGKSVFTINVAKFVGKQDIPVLILDTEMSIEDQMNRAMAGESGVDINEIATGQFSKHGDNLEAVMAAMDGLKDLPVHYRNVSGEDTQSILNIIKRWILRTVGVDENGKTNDCLVIYDYLKLTEADQENDNRKSFEILGNQITKLHNLTVALDFACIALTQLNRSGTTEESSTAIAGSDDLVKLCTSFTIFKKKSPEEMAQDGERGGTRKGVVVDCRHGPGTQDGNYINFQMDGAIARITELTTRDDLREILEDDGAIEGANQPIEEEDE